MSPRVSEGRFFEAWARHCSENTRSPWGCIPGAVSDSAFARIVYAMRSVNSFWQIRELTRQRLLPLLAVSPPGCKEPSRIDTEETLEEP
jgi:hypothetical protein